MTASASAANGAPPKASPHYVGTTSFGFQCGTATGNCPNYVWPATLAQPGLLRLHDAGTQWAAIDQGNGLYNWLALDQWLDMVAKHQPVKVMQVFAWVPCYLVGPGQCSSPPTAPSGTNVPPHDLTAAGSPAFNKFVTAFVQHCSPAGNCVKNLVRGFEMWNEWDLSYHWTGNMAQVYQMVAPAVAIIRKNIPNAVILMPSTTPDSDTGLGYQADFQNWLNYENTHGRISDWVDWHVYLTNTNTTTRAPEDQWARYNANYLTIQASTSGWQTAPWANTETNFNGAPPPGLNYTCPNAQFSPADCTGQIVRWQLLHASNGARSVDWYKWTQTVGSNSKYDNAYKNMMQYLAGGKFSAPCSSTTNNGTPTWTCNFTESAGTTALWVWTTSESGTSFTVPTGYVDYMDVTGAKTNIKAGQNITIGPQPIMLEQ